MNLHSRKHHRGFTLIEILVVITIILILVGLLFSLTGKMKFKAQSANALGSLRQVGTACVAYATENNGDINVIKYSSPFKDSVEGDIPGDNTKFYVNNSFWGRFQPYLFPTTKETNTLAAQSALGKEIRQQLNSFFSTSDVSKMTNTIISGSPIISDGSGLPVPIAFNSNVSKGGTFIKVSSFSDPSQVLYATYGYSSFNKTNGQAYAPRAKTGSPVTNGIYYLDDQTMLATYLDGHVESLRAPIPDRKFK